MADLVGMVTTPLALAALAILALTGFTQVQKARRGQTIDNRAFWIILIFGLLGSASYLLKEFAFSDIVLSGEVRTATGKPVQFATIEIPGIGRYGTNEAGGFDIPIPFSRISEKYTLYTVANGLRARPFEITGPRPRFFSITFDAESEISNFVSLHDISYLSQNVGDPLLTLGFRTNQELLGRIKLDLFEARVRLPNQELLSFFPTLSYRNGMQVPLGGLILDKDNQSAEYSIMMSPRPERIGNFFQDLAKEYGLGWYQRCSQTSSDNNALTRELASYFESVFTWMPGEYAVTSRFRIEDQVKEASYKFVVSAQDSARLNAVRSRLQRCRGVALDQFTLSALAYSDGGSSNTILRNLTPVTTGK